MDNFDWNNFDEMINKVKVLHREELRLNEMESSIIEQQKKIKQLRDDIPATFFSNLLNIFDYRKPVPRPRPRPVPVQKDIITNASTNDVVLFVKKMEDKGSPNSTVTRVARTLNKFLNSCKKYFADQPFSWIDVTDNITALVAWSLEYKHMTANDFANNGTYVRDLLLTFDNCDETRANLHRLIGESKTAIKSKTIWRPLPENAITFSEMQEKRDDLMHDEDTDIDDVVLLSLFCHPGLGVFRPGEWINCRIGKPPALMETPTNWLDLKCGTYHRYYSKTYKSIETAKYIVDIPADVLEIISLKDLGQGDFLFKDFDLEILRKRLQKLFPGKYINAQFLRSLHVSQIAMALPNRERELRALEMDHSVSTQAGIYAKY